MSEDYLPVRLSHLLRHCAVGAIVRGPGYLMTVKDIRTWTDKSGNPAGKIIRHVCRVRTALDIDRELREPPVAKELENGQIDGVCVPAVRFPSWMRCPSSSCGLLHYKPWKSLMPGEKPRCQNKKEDQCNTRPELEQVQWILVHADGHMADVPWHFLAHSDARGREQQQCRKDWNEPYLRLIDQGTAGRKILCTRCNAGSNFKDLRNIPYGNERRQPWIFESPDSLSDGPAEVLEINDTRVHSPETRSALIIPPESRICKGTVVDRLYSSSQKLKQLERARDPRGIYILLAKEFRCSKGEIANAWEAIKKDRDCSQYDFSGTHGLLLEAEYMALRTVIPDLMEGEDFVTEHYTNTLESIVTKPEANQKTHKITKSIEHLVAVNRLKEIMILKGFRRPIDEDRSKNILVPPDIDGHSDWLPALELYGEGIFFTIREDILKRWESEDSIIERAEAVKKRFDATDMRFEPEVFITPRFLLLHTFAHLLIRQLEIEAGYPAASLKERIYCTTGKGNMSMSGILIYVAVPDVVGSLGGLAELAVPERFLPLLSGVFDHAEWCSLDPVCSEHEGQGPSLLNRAACHACALIPEPSCAYGNVLLDRIFIKGDVASDIPAFLDGVD